METGMTENQTRILDLLRNNPGIGITEIAERLGIYRTTANTTIKSLQRLELVERYEQRVDANGVRFWTYALDSRTRQLEHVLTRSQRIGHPFGILAAQVMA